MEGIDRLIELMAEMLEEQRGMRKEQEKTNVRLESLESKVGNMEGQLAKNNLAIGELRISVMRLADEIEKIVLLDQRVTKLENAVFRKSA